MLRRARARARAHALYARIENKALVRARPCVLAPREAGDLAGTLRS